MPTPPLPDDAIGLLAAQPSRHHVEPPGRAAGISGDWYLWQDGRVLVNMDEGRKRLEYLRSDPRVSVTVLAAGDWYTHVSLQGRVVEVTPDEGLVDIDRLATHYTGKPYRVRNRRRVSAWIELDRWHGCGLGHERLNVRVATPCGRRRSTTRYGGYV
jgi:hypothetical protein